MPMFLLRLVWAVVRALFVRRADLDRREPDVIAYRARCVISIADFQL